MDPIDIDEVKATKKTLMAGKVLEKTIGFLPLIFANGLPADLDKLTVIQLYHLLVFLCRHTIDPEISSPFETSPQWWKTKITFSDLFGLPCWIKKCLCTKPLSHLLRGLIWQCYRFYSEEHLIKYSKVLSEFISHLDYANLNNTHVAVIIKKSNERMACVRFESVIYDDPEVLYRWISDNSYQVDLQKYLVAKKTWFMHQMGLMCIGDPESVGKKNESSEDDYVGPAFYRCDLKPQ